MIVTAMCERAVTYCKYYVCAEIVEDLYSLAYYGT